MKNKTIKEMAGLLLVSALMLCVPDTVWAAAQAAFGSEGYSPQAGESFPMGIYINADEVVSSGHTEVKYDPEMLEYVTGGELVEEGLVRLTYENVVGNQAGYTVFAKSKRSDRSRDCKRPGNRNPRKRSADYQYAESSGTVAGYRYLQNK